MIHFSDLTGLAGNALAIATACLLLPGVARLGRRRLGWGFLAVFVAVLIPFHGLPLAAYLRGAIGDLSIPSWMLLFGAVRGRLRRPQTTGESSPSSGREEARGTLALLALIVLAALALYPMALGWGSFDPYGFGYGNPWFLSALLAGALAAAFLRATAPAVAVAVAVLAWAIGWYESTNLWDYLLDPLVAIYAVGALARRAVWNLRRLGHRQVRIGSPLNRRGGRLSETV